MNSRADIANAWHDMELFSPQRIDREQDSSVTERIRPVRPGSPLPWRRPDMAAAKDGHVWRHELFLGVYDIADMFEQLDKVFVHTRELFDERPRGDSAVACVLVDQDGALVPGSTMLSSCAWGLGQCRQGRSLDHTQFEEAHASFQTAVTQYWEDQQRLAGDEPLVMKHEHVAAILAFVRRWSGLGADHLVDDVRSRSEQVRLAVRDDPIDFLNSFLLADLGVVSRAVSRGDCGSSLARYLDGPLPASTRIDLRQLTWQQTLDAVGAAALPPARWPSPATHAMALSQQMAVNLALGTIPGTWPSDLMGINGPPGTGKSTLLRDILAHLVVQRADRIAQLTHPDAAFSRNATIRWQNQNGSFQYKVKPLAPELTGFEMVVACTNNRAAENVSTELPLVEQVKGAPEADYLAAVARNVLRVSADDRSDTAPTPVWGLLAARLGRNENRRKVVQGLWWNEPAADDHCGDRPMTTLRALLDQAKAAKALGQPHRPWKDCVADYRAARARVDRLVADAAQAEQRLRSRGEVGRSIEALQAAVDDLTHQIADAKGRFAALTDASRQAQAVLDAARAASEEHLRHRPGMLEWISTFGRASRDWSAHDQRLTRERTKARDHAESLAREAGGAEQHIAMLCTTQRDRVTALHARRSDRDTLYEAVRTDHARWGAHHPDDEWWAHERGARALHSPWQTVQMNEARTALFVAALRLHEDLLLSAPTTMQMNLQGVLEAVRRRPLDLSAQQLKQLWQVFFLVVPLISTTFASLGRMFDGLPREAFGWLLVDEAGQVTPQAAVGGMWRAQHVLAVGDPLQLTPVVTLPHEAELGIAERYGVPTWTLPTSTSVQVIADHATPYGTTIQSNHESVWVGAPLVVHRRCDDPMFSISNEIAYGGLMVQGKSPTNSHLKPSCWRHVPGHAGSGHGIQSHAIAAADLVRDLLHRGVPAREIIAIAPFRQMAKLLKDAVERVDRSVAAGTVHTAQGREARVVILVLGGDNARPGAMAWAASTPNLVNVAVSRAKERLYVIGDERSWSSQSYFDVMHTALGHE